MTELLQNYHYNYYSVVINIFFLPPPDEDEIVLTVCIVEINILFRVCTNLDMVKVADMFKLQEEFGKSSNLHIYHCLTKKNFTAVLLQMLILIYIFKE